MEEAGPELISVVIPAFNEAGTIAECVRRAARTALEQARSVEVIVVDDGSRDATAREVRREAVRLFGEAEVTCLSLPRNMGKGRALRAGIARSRGDIVVLIDGDLDIPPEAAAGVIARVRAGAHLAVASRRCPGSTVRRPLGRRVLSAGFRIIAGALTGLRVSDSQCGLKGGAGGVLRALAAGTSIDRFAWDLELLALAHDGGWSIAELPVHVGWRPKDRRMRAQDVLAAFRDVLRVAARRRARAFRGFWATVRGDAR